MNRISEMEPNPETGLEYGDDTGAGKRVKFAEKDVDGEDKFRRPEEKMVASLYRGKPKIKQLRGQYFNDIEHDFEEVYVREPVARKLESLRYADTALGEFVVLRGHTTEQEYNLWQCGRIAWFEREIVKKYNTLGLPADGYKGSLRFEMLGEPSVKDEIRAFQSGDITGTTREIIMPLKRKSQREYYDELMENILSKKAEQLAEAAQVFGISVEQAASLYIAAYEVNVVDELEQYLPTKTKKTDAMCGGSVYIQPMDDRGNPVFMGTPPDFVAPEELRHITAFDDPHHSELFNAELAINVNLQRYCDAFGVKTFTPSLMERVAETRFNVAKAIMDAGGTINRHEPHYAGFGNEVGGKHRKHFPGAGSPSHSFQKGIRKAVWSPYERPCSLHTDEKPLEKPGPMPPYFG